MTTNNKAPRPVRTLSSLDDFLKQEGKFEAIAMKEVAAWQAARRAE